MEKRVIAPFVGVSVQEELGRGVPENFVRRELEENFRVGANIEVVDAFAFPGGEWWGEFHGVMLEDTEGECADGVVGVNAGAVSVVDRHSLVAVRDGCDNSIQEQS